jgi:hypothetical protein
LTDSIDDGTRRGTGDGSGAHRIDADAFCQRNRVPLQLLPYGIEALREQRSSPNKELAPGERTAAASASNNRRLSGPSTVPAYTASTADSPRNTGSGGRR